MVASISLVSLFVFGHGQEVRTAPPPIQFEPRKLIADEEDFSEYLVTFPSALTSSHIVNNQVPVRIVIPKNRLSPMPGVVILHYWGAGDLRIERSLAADLARAGVASAIVALPYHLERTPSGTRSGQLAIQANVPALIETMTQGVFDVRRAIDLLIAQPEVDAGRVGIAGTSLGSIMGALTLAVEPRIKAAGFILGGADLAHILWHSSRVASKRDELRSKGYTEAKLREELVSVEPLTYLKGRAGVPTIVIGAKFDTVVPPDDTRKLIAAIDGSRAVWLDTGHYGGIFVQRRVLRTVGTFIAKSLRGESVVVPSQISAPSVRVGASADPADGLQIAVGVDLYRANRKGDVMATFLATPRGPSLFVGPRLSPNVAIGAMIKPRKITAALLWSIIL